MFTDVTEPQTNKKLQALLEEYCNESEVCMGEFLFSAKVPENTSYEEAAAIYIAAMKKVEGDKFFTIKEGETEEL